MQPYWIRVFAHCCRLLAKFPAADADAVYRLARKMADWEEAENFQLEN